MTKREAALLGGRVVLAAAGVLLVLFALAMTFALGPKAPLDYSVYAAAAAAFLVAANSSR
jgi:hypothetical protein